VEAVIALAEKEEDDNEDFFGEEEEDESGREQGIEGMVVGYARRFWGTKLVWSNSESGIASGLPWWADWCVLRLFQVAHRTRSVFA
jgi:hypothetical protein